MNDELDIDDVTTPEHAPAPKPEEGIVVSVGSLALSHPLVDAKWMAALKSVIRQVKDLVVKDQPSLQLAVTYQARLTEARKQLEQARKRVKAPFLKACADIDAAAAPHEAEAAAAVERLRTLQINFAVAERKRVEKEEADRQERIRLAKIEADAEAARQKKEADLIAEEARLNEENDRRERDRLAAERVESPKMATFEDNPFTGLDIEETAPPAPEPEAPAPAPVKSEAQIKLEQAIHAPAPKVATAVGVQMRTTLEIETVDVAKLPDPLVSRVANLPEIRRLYCATWKDGQPIPVVEGVVFKKKELPVTRSSKV